VHDDFPIAVSSCGLADIAAALEAGPASAQMQPNAAGIRVARAARTNHAPKLDGTLDDPVWQAAAPVDDFRQREPFETQPATERTDVRILYDARHIYFGVHCYDDWSGTVATQLRRDLSMDLDDNFSIMIDPTLSRRSGYIFQVNPLGTQRDGQVIEEQAPNTGDSIVDPSWDGLWMSDAKITSDGWTATIRRWSSSSIIFRKRVTGTPPCDPQLIPTTKQNRSVHLHAKRLPRQRLSSSRPLVQNRRICCRISHLLRRSSSELARTRCVAASK
jgi:hypothetical protein